MLCAIRDFLCFVHPHFQFSWRAGLLKTIASTQQEDSIKTPLHAMPVPADDMRSVAGFPAHRAAPAPVPIAMRRNLDTPEVLASRSAAEKVVGAAYRDQKDCALEPPRPYTEPAALHRACRHKLLWPSSGDWAVILVYHAHRLLTSHWHLAVTLPLRKYLALDAD